jgi:hypothetical protein
MELDILLTIIFAVILIGAARWMIGVLIQALINLIGALVSATGAIVPDRRTGLAAEQYEINAAQPVGAIRCPVAPDHQI